MASDRLRSDPTVMDAKRKRRRRLLLTYILLELVVLMVVAYDDIAHLLGY